MAEVHLRQVGQLLLAAGLTYFAGIYCNSRAGAESLLIEFKFANGTLANTGTLGGSGTFVAGPGSQNAAIGVGLSGPGQGMDNTMSDCGAKTNEYLAGCVETDQGMLMWEDVAPESDPGVVYVLVNKGDTTALLFYAGPTITGDPRELDMPISTDDLFAIANDPRVDLTTSQEAVDAGSDLPFWQGPRR